MKQIRIGKDISLRWEITTDGVSMPLEGRDLTVELKSPIGKVIQMPFRLDGNVLIMTYYGYEQTSYGDYSITLWENRGKPGQNVVDAISAFKLVRTSQEEEDFIGGDLQVECVDLGTANLDILLGSATPGDSPDLSALKWKVDANTTRISEVESKVEENAANIAVAADAASSALTAAQAAKDAANTASENAAQAIGVANEAKGIAEGIEGKADDALTKATEAAGKADAAETAATDAKETTEQHKNDKKMHVPTNGEVQQFLMSNGDGTSKWVTLELELLYYYGIEFDTTLANPKCVRIGNPDFHKTLPIHSKIRGCLLNDDGVVIKYLNPDTWEGEILDGSSGQVMVEIPEFYIKFEEDVTRRRVKMSLEPIYGYKKINKMYISAYEATIQHSTDKLASVCSTDVDYRGGNNNASCDGTYRSFLGLPATTISLNDFRAKARKRGSVEWNCNLYRLHKMMWWLFAVEYANFNSQATFNAELDENGFHQGGLGDGVTTWDWGSWATHNGSNAFIPCGVTNSLGNHTGTVNYDVIGSDGATLKTFSVPRYRGIENPFGHLWKWTDGIKIIIQSEAAGGLSKMYICDEPSKFTNSGVGNYEYRGDISRKDGYVKQLVLGEDGKIMPLEVGGGSTTYFCDYFYTNIPSSGESECGVLFGGAAHAGAAAGFVYANANYAHTYAGAYIGSRLCFIPNE